MERTFGKSSENLRKASARVRESSGIVGNRRESSARQEGKKRGGVGGGRQERKRGGVGGGRQERKRGGVGG